MAEVGACLAEATAAGGDADFLVGWSSTHRGVVERVTYAEYALRSALVAWSLGVTQGMPIALLSLPSVSYFVTLGAIYRGGGVLISLSWLQSPEAIAHAVTALRPAALVVSVGLTPLAQAAQRAASSFPPQRVLDGTGADGLATVLGLRPGPGAVEPPQRPCATRAQPDKDAERTYLMETGAVAPPWRR